MASECVQSAPCFCSSVVVSCGMRCEVSAIGVSTHSTVLPPSFSITSCIFLALAMAIS